MDFDEAVAAHDAWKQKLSDYLHKKDGSLKSAEIYMDSRCPLGRWIYGEGAKFVRLPEFSTLKIEHARFHKAAANIVRRADAGQLLSTDLYLGVNSDFAKASASVVQSLLALKKAAEQDHVASLGASAP